MDFKIKQVGNSFHAFDEKKDKSVAFINIRTGKFVGDTKYLIPLTEHNNNFKASLIDEVLEEIKKDVASGDLTAIEELLNFVPIENLKAYLPNG